MELALNIKAEYLKCYNIEIPIQLTEAIYKNILKIKIEVQINHKNMILLYDKLLYCLLNFI